MNQHEIRAARDKALKAAFAGIGPEGHTALQIQQAAGKIHRETLRAILEDLVHARVLTVERRPKDNRYRPAPLWEEAFEAYIRTRNARLGFQPYAAAVEDDAEPAQGVPMVAYALRHQPTSVWALGARM